MKRDLYAEVSARIVAELEAGAAPWVKPWSATPGANTPCNAVSDRPYSGCNVVLLWMAQAAGYRTPRFLTFKQALELGGNVRKGERGTNRPRFHRENCISPQSSRMFRCTGQSCLPSELASFLR
jgi:antirestriction protein ArdC